MMEADGRKDLQRNKDANHLKEIQSDATSSEIVSDLEENEEEAGSSGSDPGPSPDGALDEGGEIKDAGPM
ncbi:MAG: hypothetical protein ACR2HX_05710 [Pyrinomonadaceae bacterium]